MRALHLGPILRSIARQKGTFSLVVLELASGFTIVSCLMLASSWYLAIGAKSSGHEEEDLITVFSTRAAASSDAAVALAAAREREASELARIRALPGVRNAASVSTDLLDDRWLYPTEFHTVGEAAPAHGYGWDLASGAAVADVLGLHFIEGELRPDTPDAALAHAAIVTRCLRDRLFPAPGSVLGKTVVAEDGPPVRIVGVIEDVVMRMPFMPHHACVAFRFGTAPDERQSRYLVRALPGRRREVRDAILAALPSRPPAELVTASLFEPKSARYRQIASGVVVMLAIFGSVVGIIALLGAVSVSSFMVVERTRQIGIRRALGATRGDVIRYFLVENALAMALGTGLGLVCTLALFIAMKRVFNGLELRWYFLAITAVLLWFDATLAAMIPARRAAEIPPSVASRGL